MVLRKGKHGVSTGSNVCSHCRAMSTVSCREAFVVKFLLNSNNSENIDTEEAVLQLSQHLFDGDLPLLESHKYFSSNLVNHSLNKRKRWTLSQQITDLIDEGNLEKEDYRLVMHKRVIHSMPARRRNDRDTLSYHDTKYSVHHSHPKKSLSSMSDLKLNCHRKHQDVDSVELEGSKSTSTLKSRKHIIKKPHFRGIQRKIISQPKKKSQRINIRDKSKGNCSKPGPQWYYKNITTLDQSWYRKGYCEDEELSSFEEEEEEFDEEASLYLHTDSVQVTLADFCQTPDTKQGHPVRPRCHGNQTPNTASGDNSGAYYRKNKVIYVEQPTIGSAEEQMEEEDEVLETGDITVVKNTVPSWDNVDFEGDCCRCVIGKDSVESYRLAHPGDFQVGNCAPPMMTVTVTGETTQGSLVLWQKSEWSTVSSQDLEYWVKVQSQSDQVNVKVLSTSLHNQLQTDRVLTLQEVITFVGALLDQSTRHQRCVQERKTDHLRTGQLTATLCGSVIELRTVEEAYNTLVSAGDAQTDTVDQDMNALLSTYCVLPNDLSHPPEIGFCETCLYQSGDPFADGCMLLPCGHYFCVDCWRRHIWEKIREGSHKITCQADASRI